MTAETSPGLDIVSGSSGVRADSVQKENEMRQDRAADEDAAGASAVKLAPTTPPRVTTSAPYSTNRYSEDKPRVNLSPFAFGVSNPDGCSGADGGDVAPPDDGPHPSQKSPHCGVSGPQPSHAAGKEAVFDLEDAAFSSDYFRMYEFKVKRCPRARPHDWTLCPFAHPGEKAKRRDIRRYNYSGTTCPDFRKGFCKRGDSCHYSHGVFECWLHPSRYRTQMCTDGAECKRRVCFFAHAEDEIRNPQDDPAIMQNEVAAELRNQKLQEQRKQEEEIASAMSTLLAAHQKGMLNLRPGIQQSAYLEMLRSVPGPSVFPGVPGGEGDPMRNLLTNSHFQHLGGNTNFEHQLKLLHQQQAAMAAAEIHLRLAVQRQAQTFLDAGGFCNNGARFASPVSPEPSPLQPTASEPPKGIASLEIPARHSASQQQHMTSPASEYVGCLKDPMHGVFRPPVGFMPGPGNHDQDTSNRFGLGLGPSAIWLRSSEPGQSDLGVGLSDSFSPAPRHGSEYRPMSQRRSSWGVDLPSEEAMFSDQRTTLGSRTRTSPGFNNCQQFPFGGSRPQQGDLFFDSSEDLMTQSFTSLAVGCHDGNQYMPGTSQAGLQSLQISTRLPSGQDGVVPGRLAGPTMAGLSEWSVPGSEAARW